MCKELNYTALSVQMANKNPKTICQIAILSVINGVVVFTDSFLVKPPPDTIFTFSDYHNIDKEKVQNSPRLIEIWPSISQYIENQNIVVYWKTNTQSWLEQSLAFYNIPAPKCNYIDVMDLFNTNRENFKLKKIAKDIEFDDNFQAGNSLMNVELYHAIINNLIKRHSKKFQSAFNVKFTSTKKNISNTPSIPENYSNKKSSAIATNSTGCLLFPLIGLFILLIFSLL